MMDTFQQVRGRVDDDDDDDDDEEEGTYIVVVKTVSPARR
jgi:hypothetical protein